ncbi:MAG: 1-(5-phosphoribosyl)-5-[(5-phosphoribosylamino)methylideneamino]imidazole-4-carboxamide isomerase [Culicoidibacterales bacterium]
MMIIYPAIDLKDGACVRLKQGDFSQLTIFNSDPVQQAKSYQDQGAQYIHVVDLDGAKDGVGKNYDIIARIAKAVDIPVQVGGGIRTEQAIISLLDAGVERVIIGTKAIENLAFVRAIVSQYGDKIVVSIDAKDGFVATNGWVDTTDVEALSLCQELVEIGVKTIVYTDISRDGMMAGIDALFYKQLQEKLGIAVIASGGVTDLTDLLTLAKYKVSGAITGKALYSNNINLREAIVEVAKLDVK